MIRILIVEDEPLEREALVGSLTRLFGDEASVAAVSTGNQALAVALQCAPHIVLMDIEIPGMNGIDTAFALRKAYPNIVLFFLTAYGEFSYAAQAIKVGAEDYLLKPISNKLLAEKIGEAIARVRCHQQQEKDRRRLMEQQLIVLLLSGYAEESHFAGLIRHSEIPFAVGMIAILVCPVPEYTSQLGDFLYQQFDGSALHYIIHAYDGKLYLFISGAETQGFAGRVRTELAEALRAVQGTALPMPYLSAGSVFFDLQGAHDALYHAQAQLPQLSKQTPILYAAAEAAETTDMAELLKAVDDNRFDAAITHVRRQMEHFARSGSIPLQEYARCRTLVQAIHGRLNSAFSEREQKELFELFVSSQTCEQQQRRIDDYIEALYRLVRARESTWRSAAMETVKQYIDTHYMQDIFLQQLAREMNYSDVYFSKLFKQYFRKNFIAYLTEVRLHAAKRLLDGTTQSIKQISSAVGYKDSNYFIKVFRKHIGQSPTEYRRTSAHFQGGQNE